MISVYLTDQGRRLQESLPLLSKEANDEAIAGLDEAEVRQFTQTLRKVIENLS